MEEFNFKELANCIKYHRESKNLSIKELSDLTDIDYSYLINIESGIKRPSVETLILILNALSISLSECFDKNNHKSRKVFYLRKFKLLLKNLEDSDLIFIDKIIEQLGNLEEDDYEVGF